MKGDDDLYEEFVENYFASGKESVSESWSDDLKERCLLFLKFVRTQNPGLSSRSILATLSYDGIDADVSLSGAPPPPPEELSPGKERYVVEQEIARGGMGRILLAYDRDFRRRIAMKVLLVPMTRRAEVSRFLEEAQATAQLEHPNIGPVYDVGLDESGAPFFTMKWIRGRNLEEILLRARKDFTLIRLVQILQQVAMGVDFAHSRGVVHRDLKPQNIMVGDYGEALVMDWGLAKVLGHQISKDEKVGEGGPEALAADGDSQDGEQVKTSRSEKGIHTLRGAVQGSLAYMAPEQARGEVDSIDARTDVFGLGAILYFVLTGEILYDGNSLDELLGKARRCEFLPPRERRPKAGIPPLLEEICLAALQPDKEDRLQSAREFHDRLQAYVEGIHDEERRVAEAARLFAEADRVRDNLHRARALEDGLRRQESEARQQVQDSDGADKKQSLWSLVGEVRSRAEDVARLFNETTAAYHAVLSVEPKHAGARRALAELYHGRMRAAEARGDLEAVHLYEGLVRQQQDSQYLEVLSGGELVRLDTRPVGAEVFLSRYEERGILLVESTPERLGQTPIAQELPRGSYLFRLRLDGHEEVRYPVLIERGKPIDEKISLYREGTIPEGFVQIPAGVSIVGGDPTVFSVLPRRRERLEEFFVRRFPVTLGEYYEFLTDYFAGEPPSEEAYYAMAPVFGKENLAVRTPDGKFEAPSQRHPPLPVVAVTQSAIAAFCSWLGGRLGRVVAPLTESQWERCARGADGRIFPWGNEFDWALCHGGVSKKKTPGMAAVGTFPSDTSPFGVRDLAGCVREFCEAEEGAEYVPLKGGAWYYNLAFLFRCDNRTVVVRGPVSLKSQDVGFRVGLRP